MAPIESIQAHMLNVYALNREDIDRLPICQISRKGILKRIN